MSNVCLKEDLIAAAASELSGVNGDITKDEDVVVWSEAPSEKGCTESTLFLLFEEAKIKDSSGLKSGPKNILLAHFSDNGDFSDFCGV